MWGCLRQAEQVEAPNERQQHQFKNWARHHAAHRCSFSLAIAGMSAILKLLTHPLARPSLGFAAVSVGLIYLWLIVVATRVGQESPFQIFTCVAPILLFWISLRVLLKVRKPPETVWGSVIFALLLLNLLLGFGGTVMFILGFGSFE